jgi:hypothetical protein
MKKKEIRFLSPEWITSSSCKKFDRLPLQNERSAKHGHALQRPKAQSAAVLPPAPCDRAPAVHLHGPLSSVQRRMFFRLLTGPRSPASIWRMTRPVMEANRRTDQFICLVASLRQFRDRSW